MNESEIDAVMQSSYIADFDKKYLPDVDLRLLVKAINGTETRELTVILRLRKAINDLNNATTKLMWAQIAIAVIAIGVTLWLALSNKVFG